MARFLLACRFEKVFVTLSVFPLSSPPSSLHSLSPPIIPPIIYITRFLELLDKKLDNFKKIYICKK